MRLNHVIIKLLVLARRVFARFETLESSNEPMTNRDPHVKRA
jgi:hypothetical protein